MNNNFVNSGQLSILFKKLIVFALSR